MGIDDTLKKLREALSQASDDINACLSDPALTEGVEIRDQKRLELLAEAQSSLQQLGAKLDTEMAKEVPKSRLVDFLNTLLETEYDAIFSYSYHAMRVPDKQLAEELLEFGVMEMRHFEILRNKILSYGVEPKWKLTKYMECTSIEPIELLHWHLKAEQNAIDLCKKGIAEGLDNALGGLLKKNLEEEQWHQKRLNELIEKFSVRNSQ